MAEPLSPEERIRAAHACITAFVAAVAVALAGQLAGADRLDGWLLSTRYTARLSFSIFLFAYTAPAFAGVRRLPGASSLLGGLASALGHNRCELALAFAVAHLVHFGCILVYFAMKHEVPSAVGLSIGGAGYALLFAMLVTGWSWRDSGGVRWRRLHQWAPHYLWFVVLATYVSRVGERGPAWLPFVGLTLGALAVRRYGGSRAARWQAAEAR